jgi:hypothetical protein
MTVGNFGEIESRVKKLYEKKREWTSRRTWAGNESTEQVSRYQALTIEQTWA